MPRLLTIAIITVLLATAADARRYRYYKVIKSNPPVVEQVRQEGAKIVRIIPIVRWRLWCERVGGLEC